MHSIVRLVAATSIAFAASAPIHAGPLGEAMGLNRGSPRFEASDPNAMFRASVCSVVYERLESRGARLRDFGPRTEAVLKGFRGTERLKPFVAHLVAAQGQSAFEDAKLTGQRGLGMMTMAAAGQESGEDGPTSEVRTIRGFAEDCDQMLRSWGAPVSDAEPTDMVTASGVRHPEFRLAGKRAREIFSRPEDAALALAACDQDTADIQRALAAGGDPNAKGLQEVTPLIWAIACERGNGIETLLNAGADPNFVSEGRESAVTMAAGQWTSEPLEIVLRNGGDPNAVVGGSTPLDTAFMVGQTTKRWDNYYTILEAGADVSRPGPTGDTFVDRTLWSGEYEKILELLNRGYTGDATEVGRWVESTLGENPPRGEARRQLEAIKAWCVSKGVVFPIPEREIDDSAPSPAE